METINTLKELLIDHDIRPTYQRLKILDYLNNNLTHPTVDEIYLSLSPEIPTLSKTTVYNTLKTFVTFGLVDEVKIENNEIRYDILTKPHGHFKCSVCGKIYNFDVNVDRLVSKDLDDFDIVSKNIYFSGVCPVCKKKGSI